MSGSGTGSHTTNVFRVKGSPAAAKSILQAVTPQTTLEKGDILTLGGWMKASPIVSSGTDGRFCGLKLTYTYTQTGVNGQQFNTPVEKTIPFSHTNGAWVFDAAEFTVEGPVVDNQVTVSAVYANQQNTAYFADIQLTLTETEEEEIASPCACANCAYGSYCPCECTENCDCPECKACTCPGCSHSQGEPCNCSQPTLCTCAQCRVCVCGEDCAYGKGCSCTCTANCNCPQCAKCECVNCDHAIGEACNCTDSENCTCAQCAVCVCGENCAYGKGCSCTCASAEACTCTQCDTPSKCICDGCEESDCSCRCTSEAACACLQCKRRSINTTDGNGNILTSGSFDGTKTLQTHNTYTADGNYINSSCDSTGNMVQFSYNRENGNLNAITDGEGNTVSYTYNAMRALVGVSQLVSNLSNGTSISNTYNYSNDRLTSITHNGFSYNFTYDTTWGTPTGVKVGSQNLVTYAYGTGENRERLGTITYGNGDTVTYSYDDDDNVTGISYDNGTTYAYLYTYTDGELTSITDNQSGYVTSYTDNSVEVKQGSTTLFKTGNDGEDNYTETSNGATYTYTYGDSDYTQSTGISESTSGISFGTSGINFASSSDWFGRDLSNTMTAVGSSGNLGSVGHSFTYKGNATTTTEQVDTYTSTVTPTSGTATDTEYSYTYDNNGNIRTITKDGILQYTYNYDEAGQLTRADDAVQNKSFTYTYDVGGNIVSKKEYAYTTSTLGSVVDTISYTYDGTWKDKLVSYDGKALTYDAIGNPLTYDGYTFDWNGRILNSITGNSKTLNFKYNENGLRTKKTVTQNNVTTNYTYIWNNSQLVSQSDGTNTFYFFYNDSEYAPDGFVLNGTDIYFYTKSLQGDVTGIVNANGAVVTSYIYDSWGNVLSVTGTLASTIGNANPFRYRGYYYDAETGLYYLQSRYYDPVTSRYLNADESEMLFKGVDNLFSYCDNNPVMYIDPTGYAKVHVFYYNNPDSGFADQAKNSQLYNNENITFTPFISIANFKKAWNALSGTIDKLYLYMHGGTGLLYFKGESMKITDINGLASKTVKKIYLFSCYGGAGKEGNNVAWALAKKTGAQVIACTGSVSYNRRFVRWGAYLPRVAFKTPFGAWVQFYYEQGVAKSTFPSW
ncbi:MAG: RHS repeat-associated core domain-containing protein [Acutalibacteraceae bacterium]